MVDSTEELIEQGNALFAEHKEDLPEEWHETFDELTSQGKAPSSIKATIEYVTTEKTQSQVSDEFNVTEMTIRALQAEVVALGPVDHITAGGRTSASMSSMDYCNYLADVLGWTEGTEYSVSKWYSADSPRPRLLKKGWESLYQETISDD